jgi:hypothetical protein
VSVEPAGLSGRAAGVSVDPERVWPQVVAMMKQTNFWAGLVDEYRLRSIAQGVAHLEVLDPRLKSHSENARQRQELEGFLSQAAGVPLRLQVAVAEASTHAPAAATDPRISVDPKLRARAEQDPLVRRAMELFNARITDVDSIGVHARPPADAADDQAEDD